MRKFVLGAAILIALLAVNACGKSYCKKYTAKFCTNSDSAECMQAKTTVKDWSNDKCRIELNNVEIEEQSKKLDDLLK